MIRPRIKKPTLPDAIHRNIPKMNQKDAKVVLFEVWISIMLDMIFSFQQWAFALRGCIVGLLASSILKCNTPCNKKVANGVWGEVNSLKL
jgi:hypothetical protein